MTTTILAACLAFTLALAALAVIASAIEPHLKPLWSLLGLGDES